MNLVVLIGNLVKDVELKATTLGKEVCSFTLAVQRSYKNTEGKYDSDFINCIAYGKTAEMISKYTKKGDKLSVEGRISTRNYEKDGKKVYVTEILVSNIGFLTMRKETKETPKQEEKQTDVYAEFGKKIEREQQELDFDNELLPF